METVALLLSEELGVVYIDADGVLRGVPLVVILKETTPVGVTVGLLCAVYDAIDTDSHAVIVATPVGDTLTVVVLVTLIVCVTVLETPALFEYVFQDVPDRVPDGDPLTVRTDGVTDDVIERFAVDVKDAEEVSEGVKDG